jgi:hypothetical protein
LTFTEPTWEQTNQPGYSNAQADELVRAHKAGAHGLKVLKTLGSYWGSSSVFIHLCWTALEPSLA